MARSIFSILKDRHTTFEFIPRKVSGTQIKKILEIARWAPSSHNDQNWHFIVVRKKKTIRHILENCIYGAFYTAPPVLIAIVALPIYLEKKGMHSHHLKVINDYHRYLNIGFVSSQLLAAAEGMDLDNCIVSPTNNAVERLLGVKAPAHIPIVIGIGHAMKHTISHKRSRKPLAELVSHERYR